MEFDTFVSCGSMQTLGPATEAQPAGKGSAGGGRGCGESIAFPMRARRTGEICEEIAGEVVFQPNPVFLFTENTR